MHVPCSHVHQQGACSTSTRGATGTPHTHASVQPGRRERATIRTPSRPKRVENAWGIRQHGAAALWGETETGNPTRPDRTDTWCAVRLKTQSRSARGRPRTIGRGSDGGNRRAPAARTQRQHGTYQHGLARRRRVDSAVSLSCPVPRTGRRPPLFCFVVPCVRALGGCRLQTGGCFRRDGTRREVESSDPFQDRLVGWTRPECVG